MKTKLLSAALFCALASFAAGVEIKYASGAYEISGVDGSGFSVTQKQILKCTPKITGTYESVSESSIRLYPKPMLSAGVNYSCEARGVRFEFETEPFSTEHIALLRPGLVAIKFNDAVSKDALQQATRIYRAQNLAQNDISYELSSHDDRNFLFSFDPKAQNVVLQIESLTSKAGAKLQNPVELRTDEEPFNDSINASNLSGVQIRPAALKDGSLAARVCFPNYMDELSAKYVRIAGVSKFSLTQPRYYYYDEDEEGGESDDPSCYYYADIVSDEFMPNKSYEIRLLKGFGDSSYILRDEIKQSVKMGDRLPFVAFSDEKNFIPKSASLAFKSSNVNEVKISIAKVPEQNFRYFLNFESNEDSVGGLASEIAVKSFDIGGAKNAVAEHKIAMDFKGYEDGIYKITAFYKVGEKMQEVSRVAYLSDITAQVVLLERGALIYTSRLSNGEELSRAKVKIYSDKNELIAEDKTDGDGILRLENMEILAKNPRSIEISKGDEHAFVLFNNAVASVEKTITAKRPFVYLASELISPNERLLGTIVMKNRDFSSLKNTPIKFKIYDPSGTVVITRAQNTDEFGSVKIDELMGEKSGTYRLDLIYEDKIIASKSFSVENFVPNRIKNEILTAKDEYGADEIITLKLSSNYLAGAPAGDLKGSLEANAYEKELKIKGYEGFSFLNDRLKKKGATQLRRAEFTLSSAGKKELALSPAAADLNVSNAINILLNFSVTEEGKNVSAYRNLSYLPYDRIVGIRASKDFISSGDSVKFGFALLDSKTKTDVKGKIDVEIYRDDFTYVYDGNRYVEQESFNLVSAVSTDAREFEYKFQNGGNYLIVANDYSSGASAGVRVDVSGWGYYGRVNAKDVQSAKIKLANDKVKAGDKIKGVINSPVESGVLNISLVGEQVYDYKILSIKGGSAEFELSVPDNFVGGHINAVIARAATPAAMPLRAYANVPVALDASSHKAGVQILAEKSYKNGQNAQISVKSEPNSKVILYAVDLGILDIVSQEELDAFKAFDVSAYFALRYFDIYDDLSVYQTTAKELSFGGDGVIAKAKRNLSPVENKKQKKFIKMLIAKADANGEAKFELAMPKNFNSTIRLSAMAIGEAATIGSANVEAKVRDDVIIKPADLTYMVRGDEISVPLTLINTTDKEQKAVLKISSSPSVAISGGEANFTLKPLEVKHTNFTASALDIADANIKFDLDANGQKFSSDVEFDIISQFPRSKLFHVSYGDKPVTLKIDPSYKEIYTHISATPNAFSLADELYLYPYGCTEQLASRMIAVDYVARKDSNKTLTNRVNEYASRILSRLKPNGDFGYWSAHGVTNYYASIYASDVLLELDARYKFLSNKQRSLIFSALKSSYKDQDTLRIYADFVLDQYGKLDDDEINFVYDSDLYKDSPMASIALAAILKKHNMTTEFEFMLEKIDEANYDYADNGAGLTFASDVRDAAFKLYAFGKAGIKDDSTARTVDAIIRDLKNINNTQERASVIRGFDAYFKDSKKEAHFTLKYDGEAKNFNSPLDTKLAVKDGAIEFTPMSGNGELFFTALGFGYESAPLKHEALSIQSLNAHSMDSKRIEIYREFIDARGNIVDLNKLKVGQKIYSKISWRANYYLYNFVIDEAMPSCFEAVNERLGSAAQARVEGMQDSVALEHTEYLYDRVLRFPKSGYFYYDPRDGENSSGVIYTPINVIMAGSCALPAISIEDMQYEQVNNYDLQTLKFKVAR